MCAIIDANVTFEVFGQKRTAAGIKFREWLEGKRGMLVVGGKNLQELQRNNHFKRWFLEARRSKGQVRQTKQSDITHCMQNLPHHGPIKSNDAHVLALAVASGARFLYTNDRQLMRDFSNPIIIPNPNGVLYTTSRNGAFRDEHRELLNKNHCK